MTSEAESHREKTQELGQLLISQVAVPARGPVPLTAPDRQPQASGMVELEAPSLVVYTAQGAPGPRSLGRRLKRSDG